MTEALRWILGLAVTVVAIVFAIANRDGVSVVWSPVNEPVVMPVCILALGGVMIGFILGALLVWLDAGSLRRERRQQRKKINRLERQIENTDDTIL